MPDNQFTLFTNGRYCLNGELVDDHLVISEETGLILKRTGYIGGEIVDLEDNIIAPGFLELHANGVNGFHYTHFEDAQQYSKKLHETASFYVTQGVTGFWATIPTVKPEVFQKILPSLAPRSFDGAATLMGAHVEGPYLNPRKKGAHNASLFQHPSVPTASIYGSENLKKSIKLITVAPELDSAPSLIHDLNWEGIVVSMGHSDATYSQGVTGLIHGASCLTHTLNAMAPLGSRESGLAGLIGVPDRLAPPSQDRFLAAETPYYTLIADGHHLSLPTLSLLHKVAPHRSILITDSIELASPSIPPGTYPGNAQIAQPQQKLLVPGFDCPKAVIEGTDTLIGGCGTLAEGVRNLMKVSQCGVAAAVRCVTENVAGLMGVDGPGGVGVLQEGRRADLCVLSEEGEVLQTWVAGRKVWEREGGL
ncbi:carbohydrate esterase family 9 protein [Saccharata proteae CBS 121410]|uniref:N-acetylglucosamine-6-phosphate deacetylase n=1 Tax=Saccharata proteae CBS 121410 TaxID=1314787 RepID=A0A9P4I1S1_9PEZI|nr:carbohydrate esterase family 9 protein [Saccharata proteae CBS 121410]